MYLRMLLCGLTLAASVVVAGPLEDARAMIDAERWDAAVAVLEQAVTRPGLEARAAVLLAEVANRQSDWETALRWGRQALEADATSSAAQYQYAVALRQKMQQVSRLRAMMSLGDYKKALARAIELDPRNVDAWREQIGFYREAPGVAGGSLETARERAAALRAIDWRAGTIELAQIEEAAKDPAAAGRLWAEYLERHSDDAGARMRLAYVLQQQERWQEADAQWARLAGVDGEPGAVALYQRARTRILGGYEPQQAIAYLQQYLARVAPDGNPSPSAAWWRIGNAYEQLGKADDAREAYREALRLDADNDEARKALKKL